MLKLTLKELKKINGGHSNDMYYERGTAPKPSSGHQKAIFRSAIRGGGLPQLPSYS